MGMPVFYFPFVMHPVQKEQRQTGLLIPSFGNSSTKGRSPANPCTGSSIAAWTPRWAPNTIRSAAGSNAENSALVRATAPICSSTTWEWWIAASASTAGSRRRGRAFSCRASFRELPRRRECRLFEFVRFPHRLHRCVHAGHRLGSEIADFSFQYDQRISLQCPGGALPELRSLHSAGTGNGSCTTLTQTELVRILHTPSFFLSGEERQLGNTPLYWSFESAAEGLQRRQTPGCSALGSAPRYGGQVRSRAFAFDALAMAGMVVPSRSYAAGYVLHARSSTRHWPRRRQSRRRHS